MSSISVLINSYNYARFVVLAIESVLRQTLPPDEVIVVDDGSTDDTQAILAAKYAGHPKIKVIHQQNGGQLSAFVAGLDAAQGDILCFLDADDEYEPNHLENVARAFHDHRDVSFVFTALRIFGDGVEDRVETYAPADSNLGYSTMLVLYKKTYVGSVSSTMSIRRELGQILMPILRREIPTWRVCADVCILYGASLAGEKKYFLAEPTVRYRRHGNNLYMAAKKSDPSKQPKHKDPYFHGLRRAAYVQQLSDYFGLKSLGQSSLAMSERFRLSNEFQSIEKPSKSLYNDYLDILWHIDLRWLDKLKIWSKMRKHYRRNHSD